MKRFDINDLIGTESDSSSSSDQGVFETNALIFDLHELKKDAPKTRKFSTEAKIKKKKKKRLQPVLQKGSSSSVLSENVPTVINVPKEEFFDAHESYYKMDGNNNSQCIQTNGRNQQTTLGQRNDVKIYENKNAEDNSANPQRPLKNSKPAPHPSQPSKKLN